jgi:hypothetical protein
MRERTLLRSLFRQRGADSQTREGETLTLLVEGEQAPRLELSQRFLELDHAAALAAAEGGQVGAAVVARGPENQD